MILQNYNLKLIFSKIDLAKIKFRKILISCKKSYNNFNNKKMMVMNKTICLNNLLFYGKNKLKII